MFDTLNLESSVAGSAVDPVIHRINLFDASVMMY